MRFEKLQNWQRENGVEDAELAAKCDCSRQTIQRLHKGESMPRRSTLAVLKQITGVTPAECAAHIEAVADEMSRAPVSAEAAAPC